jgi:hypothetical protein
VHFLLLIFVLISPIRSTTIFHRCTLVHVLMDLFFSKGNKKSVYVCTNSCIVCSVNEVPTGEPRRRTRQHCRGPAAPLRTPCFFRHFIYTAYNTRFRAYIHRFFIPF